MVRGSADILVRIWVRAAVNKLNLPNAKAVYSVSLYSLVPSVMLHLHASKLDIITTAVDTSRLIRL